VRELVEYMVRGIVDDPDGVEITEHETPRRIVYEVVVAEDDIGKVIGRGGRVANAIRELLDRCRSDDNRERTVKIVS
jgi:predicted RNA-binding protein YlqC (UPF0109 family)